MKTIGRHDGRARASASEPHGRGISRRGVLGGTALAAAGGLGLNAIGRAQERRRDEPRGASSRARNQAIPMIKPRRLSVGDTLGLVLPASLEFEASRIDLARRQLEALGFSVRLGTNVRNRSGSLAGSDEERARDVMAMFADPEIDGVICHRGGWGTPRVLPLLDYDLIRENPKVIIGFSDITALVNAIHLETGLVTFHGPNGATPLRPYTLDHFRRAVMSTEPLGVLRNPPKREDELVNRSFPTVTVRGGRASGPLVGGNLTLIASAMGTPWEIRTEGCILLLEDVDEALYRVDRMLTQLALGGKLARVAGVAFGVCSDCPPGEGPAFSLEELMEFHLGRLGVPVVAGLAFGHREQMMTLPIGLPATLDADEGSLGFAEAAVT